MAAVMSAPPPLPDRRDRPPPPPIASMPSRNRPTSLKTGTTNSKRPLPPPPTSNGDLSSRLSTPDHQRSRKHSDNYDSRPVIYPADRTPTKTSNTLPRVHTAPSFDAPPPLPPRRAETMRPSHGVSSRVVTSHEKPSKDILSLLCQKDILVEVSFDIFA